MQSVLKILKRILPVLILVAGMGIVVYMFKNKPVAERRPVPEPIIEVEALPLQPVDYTVLLESQGTVTARTRSTLIPEVSGKIIRVARNFREGGFFNEGDVLLEIDSSDYETAVTIAQANLAEARVRLAEEEASAKQAQIDWDRLGAGEKPTDLVLRGPQLALARANVAAAEARLQEATRDLERTRITVPYEGRVLTQQADIGQVVSPGTILAEVYAVDYAEIRLPLTTAEYSLLDLPPVTRSGSADFEELPVLLTARFGQEVYEWEGRIVRVEGAIDTRSRQIYVVAQVDDPYGDRYAQPLKVGLFVEAQIRGSVLKDVYTLPRTALREARFVLTLDEEDHRVPIEPLWSNTDTVVFRSGEIPAGTLACITQIPLAIDGMEVKPTVVGLGQRSGDK